MKSVLSIVALAFMVTVAFAQTKPVSTAPAGRQDTLQQTPCMQDQQSRRFGWHEHSFPGFNANRAQMFGDPGMHEKFGDRMGQGCQMCPMPGMRMHCMNMNGYPGHHLRKLLFLGALLMIVINILLTIIVAVDMSRIGKFNGLWIALALLAGIPGTALYALFRVGDAIERARTKA